MTQPESEFTRDIATRYPSLPRCPRCRRGFLKRAALGEPSEFSCGHFDLSVDLKVMADQKITTRIVGTGDEYRALEVRVGGEFSGFKFEAI